MQNILFHAHSGLRFLVLLAGFVAVGYLAYGLAARHTHGKGARVVTAIYTGLLDLQVLLGILLVISGIFYPRLIGHLSMMILAVVVVHALTVMGRKSEDPRRRYGLSLLGVAGSLVLIFLGISAIGRSPFQATPRASVEQAP